MASSAILRQEVREAMIFIVLFEKSFSLSNCSQNVSL